MSLSDIQKRLKAPKDQTNSFGGYKYRTCGAILEAVKPMLGDATITLTDDLVMIGERYYVKATATYKAEDETISVAAYAREAQSKKGSDEAQITGAASTYARKTALAGLFALDDSADDPDMTNTHGNGVKHGNTQPSRASSDPLRSAKVRLAKAIDAWAERTGNDAAATKKSVPTMPGHAETVDWYTSTAKQFEEAK